MICPFVHFARYNNEYRINARNVSTFDKSTHEDGCSMTSRYVIIIIIIIIIVSPATAADYTQYRGSGVISRSLSCQSAPKL